MGLDMYLYRANLHGHSIEQAMMVENLLDLKQHNAEHPDKQYTLKEWCNQDESLIDPKALADLTPEFQLGYYYWDTRKAYGHNHIFQHCGYWRKANAIHAWFVENVQNGVDDCGMYIVRRDQLEELKEACERVIAVATMKDAQVCTGISYKDGQETKMMEDGKIVANPEACADILPTQGGFFFGSTDYDEWYIHDMETTIKIINEVLEQTDWEKQTICYSSSW